MNEVFKKWWFWVIVGFVLISFSQSCSNKNKELTSYTDQFVIQVWSKNVKVNDLELTLDAPVRELESLSYMPLRFLLDWFGAEDVTYDRATEVITFKLTRYQELDPAIIAKYDSKRESAKPVEPKKELAKKVEPPTSSKGPLKVNVEEMKLILLNIMKETLGDIGTCSIGDDLKAFKIIPFDEGYAEAAVLAKQGNVEVKKSWDILVNGSKSLSIKIHEKLPGYSLLWYNPVNTDLILIAIANGKVLINAGGDI
jgi:hypothetical protein